MQIDGRILSKMPDCEEWRRGGPDGDESRLDLFDFISLVATADLFLGFAELFHPELVIHEGIQFIKARFSVASYNAWKAKGLNAREIQRVMNHLHLSRLFQVRKEDDEVLRVCAVVLSRMWSKTFSDIGLSGELIEGDAADLSVTLVTRI